MENNQNRDGGFHAFIRGIILFGFTMLFLSLIIQGSISYYIAPKMMPFIYFGTGVFFLLSVIQIIRSTPKGQQEEIECDCGTSHQMNGSIVTKLLIYSIFVIPLLTGFIFPDKALDSSVAAKRGVVLGKGQNVSTLDRVALEERQQQLEDFAAANEASSTPRADEYLANRQQGAEEEIEHYTMEDLYYYEDFDDYYHALYEEYVQQDIIVIDEENYLDMMTILDLYLEYMLGKEVVITGFVYREPGIKMDEMVVARFSMTCCTADSAVYGIMIKGEETRAYDNDTWVQVRGVLEQGNYNEWAIPVLQLIDVQEVAAPDTPYVYPSFF